MTGRSRLVDNNIANSILFHGEPMLLGPFHQIRADFLLVMGWTRDLGNCHEFFQSNL